MITISVEDYNKISKDYRGVWSSDEIRGTKNNGKKTWMVGKNGVTTLLIEGSGFTIVDLDEDGCFEDECSECDGSGSVEHDVSCSHDITPQSEWRKCENCNGGGVVETLYEGI